MKQLNIRIVDINGKDWGMKSIVSLNWNLQGDLWSIQVDFMGNHQDLLIMYDYDGLGEFKNTHGNLIGRLK